jgi:2-amino-4-hydroxy-6-hydroxymethyldihydropteridine diphosphokinase
VIVHLGLGTNLGDRLANLKSSLDRLATHPDIGIAHVSPVYETDPVGGPEQPCFLNAAAAIETSLSASDLLAVIRSIEIESGRKKTVRWGPRVLDIDILLYGDTVLKSDTLTVPHPGMHERAFVLVPLADIAPDALHPVFGTTVSQLLSSVDTSGIRKTVASLV